jgi:hypothetical protein
VLDGLKNCGVLLDDKYDVIGQPTCGWEKGQKGKGHIIVRVEERSYHGQDHQENGEKAGQKDCEES